MSFSGSVQRFVSFVLVIAMLASSVPIQVFARPSTQPEIVSFVDVEGNLQQVDSESWAEMYPYGTFAFSHSELNLTENESSATIAVYRLGGTLGRVSAFVSYTPLVIDQDGAISYSNAIKGSDVRISIEDPAPQAAFQPIGKAKDPLAASPGVRPYIRVEKSIENPSAPATGNSGEQGSISNQTVDAHSDISNGDSGSGIHGNDGNTVNNSDNNHNSNHNDSNNHSNNSVSNNDNSSNKSTDGNSTGGSHATANTYEPGTVELIVDIAAESYQWYAHSGERWQQVIGATQSFLPIALEDLQAVDIRLEYVVDGQRYCTDSYHGERYIPSEDYYDGAAQIIDNTEYQPTFTDLDLLSDEYGAKSFEVVFADGEWIKEIVVTPLDNQHTDPLRMSTLLIYDCEGGELYDTANTLTLTLLDDEEQEQAIFGFTVSEVFADINSGKAYITVTRSGDPNHLSTINYKTIDGTAIAGKDYAAASGTLGFYNDVTEQTIEIELMNSASQVTLSTAGDEPLNPESFSEEQIGQLKRFGIELMDISGGGGKDIIAEGQGYAEVLLYSSGLPVKTTLASLLYNPHAKDVSANARVADEGLILSETDVMTATSVEAEPLSALVGEIAKGDEVEKTGGFQTFDLETGIVANTNQLIFRRPSVGGSIGGVTADKYLSSYWRDYFTIAANTNESPQLGIADANKISGTYGLYFRGDLLDQSNGELKLRNKDSKYAYLQTSYFATLFSGVSLRMYFLTNKVAVFGWVIHPRIGVGDTVNPFSQYIDGHTSSGGSMNATKDFTWGMEVGYGNPTNRIALAIVEKDGKSGMDEAEATIQEGYLKRRFFTSSFGLKAYTPDDITVNFDGVVSIVENEGGVNSKGKVYVGTKISVNPKVFSQYTPRNSGTAVFLSDETGNTRAALNKGEEKIDLIWQGMSEADLGRDYTINIIYDRTQNVVISLDGSILEENETNPTEIAATVTKFKDSLSASGISYGYSEFNDITKTFEEKTGYIAKGSILGSLETTFRNMINLKWINFNLPEEDLILFSGSTYKGNERIYFSGTQFSAASLVFTYYAKDFQSIEKSAKVRIDHIELYLDANGDGMINGSIDPTNGEFKTEQGDLFLGRVDPEIQYDESIFAPVEVEGTMRQKLFKAYYDIRPRCLITPAGKEDVVGQLLPAFTTNITEPSSLKRLTAQQLEYRFVEAAKDAKKAAYLSDDIVIYTAAASAMNMIDFPLGGDTNPYSLKEDKAIIWEPDYQGNLIFPYANPEPITLRNTIVGEKDLVQDYDYTQGVLTYEKDGASKVNGYLGSYVGNSVFSLVLREQNDTEKMAKLLAERDISKFTTVFESIAIGGRGTFQTPNGLMNLESDDENAPDINFNSGKESTGEAEEPSKMRSTSNGGDSDIPEGFDVDLRINMPEINFENSLGFDGVGFSVSGTRIGFTIGYPFVNKEGASASEALGATNDSLNPVSKIKDKANQYAKESEPVAAKKAADPDAKGLAGSNNFGIGLTVGAAFFWEYNPVFDTFKFSDATLTVTASFTFTLKYRFVQCPLFYVYLTTGISVGLSVGLIRDLVEEVDSNPIKLHENIGLTDPGVTNVTLEAYKSMFFTTDVVGVYVHFEGELLVTMKDAGTGTVIRKARIVSEDTGNPYHIDIATYINSTIKKDGDKPHNVSFELKAPKESVRIEKITAIKQLTTKIAFSGFILSPSIFLEVGIGLGIDLAKVEAFFKVSISAAFAFGGYTKEKSEYKGAKVSSFNLTAAVGIRVAFFIFTYELTGVAFFVEYDETKDFGDEPGANGWDHGWIFLNGYTHPDTSKKAAAQARSFGVLDIENDLSHPGEASDIMKTPQSTANTQRFNIAKPADTTENYSTFGAQTFGGGLEDGTEVPFQISEHLGSNSEAYYLVDGLNLGYDYRLVTVDQRHFLIFLMSDDSASPAQGLHATQLMAVELVKGADDRYGFATNPVKVDNSTVQTGDVNFSVYADAATGSIYISWLDYLNTLNEDDPLSEAVRGAQLKHAKVTIPTTPGDSLTVGAAEVVSEEGESPSFSAGMENAVAYVVPEFYDDILVSETGFTEYGNAKNEYLSFLVQHYGAPTAEEGEPLNVSNMMLDLWEMRAQSEGKASVLKVAYKDPADSTEWNYLTVQDVGSGYKVSSLSMSPAEEAGTYWLSYVTEQSLVTEDNSDSDYVTIKQLNVAFIDPDAALPPQSYTLKTIVDYELASDEDGEYSKSIKVRSINAPTLGSVRFLNGKLPEMVDAEALLLYDYCGNTYVLSETELNKIVSAPEPDGTDKQFTSIALFETEEDQAAAKTEAYIGVDGAGNISIAYVGTVPGTTNNALFVAKYNEDTKSFGAGQMLAMNHMGVYEDRLSDVGRTWSEEELESAYYGDLSGYTHGGPTTFSFSNLQVAFGEPATEEEAETPKSNGSMLLLSGGVLSDLTRKDFGDQKGVISLLPSEEGGKATTGFYALEFGIGHPAIGKQKLSFHKNDFTNNSILSATLSFKNTGDVPFRASEDTPATVRFLLDINGDTTKTLLKEWTIDQPVDVGRIVALEGNTQPLPQNLGAGSAFYLEISENDAYDTPRTASTRDNSALTLKDTVELKLSEVSAHVVGADAENVELYVEFVASNTGGLDSEKTNVQFSYRSTEVDTYGEPVYIPLNISGHTLNVGEQEKIQPVAFRVPSGPTEGILELNGPDGTELDANYRRSVSGTITISKDDFNAAGDGTFGLRLEIYDNHNEVDADANGMVIANADEYNLTNNYVVLPVLPKTFYNSAENVAISLGNVYKMPVKINTTSQTVRMSATEFPSDPESQDNFEPIMGTLYYDHLGYVNMMGRSVGSGIIRIANTMTSDFKDVPFRTTLGEGINIYEDNGIFTFWNAEGNRYDPEAVPATQNWEFDDGVMLRNGGQPLNNDLAIGKNEAFFTFDTFASEIELYFAGSIMVYSDLYQDFFGGIAYSSESILTPVKITFNPDKVYQSQQLKIKVTGISPTEFDKIIEVYGDNPPTPADDDNAPTIFWNRSWPEKASVTKGANAKLEMTAYIYDPSGVAGISLSSGFGAQTGKEPIKISDQLWSIDLVFTENGYYQLTAQDQSGNHAYSSVSLECFIEAPEAGTVATAPEGTANLVDMNGNPVTTTTSAAVYLELAYADFSKTGISAQVYQLIAGSDGSYTESPLNTPIVLTNPDRICFELGSNGLYRYVVTDSTHSGDRVSWSQGLIEVTYVDTELPVVAFSEFVNTQTGERSLFYYATKTGSGAQVLDASTQIASASINGVSILQSEAKIVTGYYPIRYAGAYTFEVTDNAGNTNRATVTVKNFPVHPGEGFIEQEPVTSQSKNNGAWNLDLNTVSGGAYAHIDTDSGTYTGSYEVAYVAAEDAFAGDAEATEKDIQEAEKEFFKNLDWNATAIQSRTGLEPGDWMLYVRDATDINYERNATIARLPVAIADHVISATYSNVLPSNSDASDGSIRVAPASGITDPEYQIALVTHGNIEPAAVTDPKDIENQAWQDVSWGEYEFTDLEAGWYQIAVKTATMNPETDAEKIYQQLLFLPAKVNAAMPVIASFTADSTVYQDIACLLEVVASSGDGGELSYQWYSFINDEAEAGEDDEDQLGTPVAIEGATEATYTPPTDREGTAAYAVEITNTIDDNGDGGEKQVSISSAIVRVTVEIASETIQINAVKEMLEATEFIAPQAQVTNMTEAKAAVEALLANLTLNGITAVVQNGEFTAAAAGTSSNREGTEGSYTFTLVLSKGIGRTQVTETLTLHITATPYKPGTYIPPNQPTAPGGSTGGTVTTPPAEEPTTATDETGSGALPQPGTPPEGTDPEGEDDPKTVETEDTIDILINEISVTATLSEDGTLKLFYSEADIARYMDSDGTFTLEIADIPSLEIALPIEALEGNALVIETDFGTIEISAETLQKLRALYGDTLRLVLTQGSLKVALVNAVGEEIAYNDPLYPFKITLPYTLQEGQKEAQIVAIRRETAALLPLAVYQPHVSDIGGGACFNIAMTGHYDLIYNPKIFADIANHWAGASIDFTAARELFSGTGNELFSPDAAMTRAMFATVLVRLDGADLSAYSTTTFADVPQNAWYAASVAWASAKGIINGVGENRFDPEAAITREQMATILSNYIRQKGHTLAEAVASATFADAEEISSWAVDAVGLSQRLGLLGGRPGNLFDPQGTATRAEVAALFTRFIEAYSRAS